MKISTDDIACLEVIRTNSKEHSFLIKGLEKKSKYGLSKFSSHQGSVSQSMGNLIGVKSMKASMKDYHENSLGESHYPSVTYAPAEIQKDNKLGFFCSNQKCNIF